MTPKRQRLWFTLFCVACLTGAVLLTLQAFRANIVFFYTPSELTAVTGQSVRLGGLVEQGSVHGDADATHFTVTDGSAAIIVSTRAVLPSLFREGQGVVAEGRLTAPGQFAADRVLAKHDENYMPKEVADKLKATGHWHGGGR